VRYVGGISAISPASAAAIAPATGSQATGEIGAIVLRGTERMRKQTRVEFLCGGRVRLVLGCHPCLGGFLDELLADGMHAAVEQADGTGALRALDGSSSELGK
jgi:hypothetical protein